MLASSSSHGRDTDLALAPARPALQVPFQDDYRRNYFPSLEFPKNEDGDLVTEHSTLPTDEQKAAMGELIDKSILDTLGEDGSVASRLDRPSLSP